MKIFSRRKPEDFDEQYDPDEVFQKNYASFAESVRGEVNHGSEDCKQIDYTLHDGRTYVVRTIAEYVVFAAPAEYIDLTWAVAAFNHVSTEELPILSSMKSATTMIHEFAFLDVNDESLHRTAELLSSFTFDTIRLLDSLYDQVQRVQSRVLMYDEDIVETRELAAIGQLPIHRIDEALQAAEAAELEMYQDFGFATVEASAHSVVRVTNPDALRTLPDHRHALDSVMRGILVEHPDTTLPALQDVTQGLLWRDMFDVLTKLVIQDVVTIQGGSSMALPDVDDFVSTSLDTESLTIEGEVVEDTTPQDGVTQAAIEGTVISDEFTEAELQALEGLVLEDSVFEYHEDDDGDFEYEQIFEDDQGLTTKELDDTLLSYDAKNVIEDADMTGRDPQRAIRFLDENERLERELIALEEGIVITRKQLNEQKQIYGELALQQEFYRAEKTDEAEKIKDQVHNLYFQLAEREEERSKLNAARLEVLTEAHDIFEHLHAQGVQDILNRIEQKQQAIRGAINVAYQSVEEEAEEALVQTQMSVAQQSRIGTPIFDRLMKKHNIGLS